MAQTNNNGGTGRSASGDLAHSWEDGPDSHPAGGWPEAKAGS